MPNTTKTSSPSRTRIVRRADVVKSLGPVALIWAIAKSMPRASRGEILAACDAAGINHLTSASQVQQFLHLRDLEHAERAKRSGRSRKAPARSTRKRAAA